LANDLEAVTINRFPVIQEIKDTLLASGARGVLMSGSGPTVFAVFEKEQQASDCQKEIAQNTAWYSLVTRTV
jgi:4-diphosphocytidyl-2-C-methyl-D-erythritol kinase